MKTKLAVLALALLSFVWPAQAQQGNTVTIRFPGAPSGACAPLSFGINSATGDLYDCVAAAWVKVGTGGGGGGISIAITQLASGSGANTIGPTGSWANGGGADTSFLGCLNDDNCYIAMSNVAMDNGQLGPGVLFVSNAGVITLDYSTTGVLKLGNATASSGQLILRDITAGQATLGEVEGKEFNLNGLGLMAEGAGGANTDFAGTVTNSGGTGTYSFTRTFAIAPICIARDETTLANLLTVSVNTTGVTATTTGMTDHWSYICVGRT